MEVYPTESMSEKKFFSNVAPSLGSGPPEIQKYRNTVQFKIVAGQSCDLSKPTGETYKTNGKKIRSIGVTRFEKNPKNYPEMLVSAFCPSLHSWLRGSMGLKSAKSGQNQTLVSHSINPLNKKFSIFWDGHDYHIIISLFSPHCWKESFAKIMVNVQKRLKGASAEANFWHGENIEHVEKKSSKQRLPLRPPSW